MIKKYKVVLTEQFNKELDNIIYYSLCSPTNLKKLYSKIKKTVLGLNMFPERFYKMSDIPKHEDLNIRRLPIDKFVIIYEVNKNLRSSFCSTYILWKSKLF